MSEFIRKSSGNIEATENVKKLQDIACIRRPVVNTDDIDNFIAQTHICSVELMHLIKTEEQMDNIQEQLSDELKMFSNNVAKEFMCDVIDPFCESMTKFLEKHPEYLVKGLTIDSRMESGKSVAMREMKHMLIDLMG